MTVPFCQKMETTALEAYRFYRLSKEVPVFCCGMTGEGNHVDSIGLLPRKWHYYAL
jgi:hypothetical protein